MNFLIDAQLPRLLAVWLRELGHDAAHTLDLENGNRSSDQTISALANEKNAVVVSKDRDFLDSHLLSGNPSRLLMVATGNTPNRQLLSIFENHSVYRKCAGASQLGGVERGRPDYPRITAKAVES